MGEEQAKRITNETIVFMSKLLEAGSSPEFVLQQGFKYACLKVWEDDKAAAAIQGLYDHEEYEIERDRTEYMDNAAIVLTEASKALGLTLKQQREQ